MKFSIACIKITTPIIKTIIPIIAIIMKNYLILAEEQVASRLE
jgi:hypothetical protein